MKRCGSPWQSALTRAEGVRLLGHAGEATHVVETVRQDHPDVVLLEIKRGDGMGLELLRQLHELPELPAGDRADFVPDRMGERCRRRAGAAAYLLKEIGSEELIRHIQDLTD